MYFLGVMHFMEEVNKEMMGIKKELETKVME